MDITSKGRRWVGFFVQKLETIIQEMDDVVSKDSVKVSENQVPNKWYANVVKFDAKDLSSGSKTVNLDAITAPDADEKSVDTDREDIGNLVNHCVTPTLPFFDEKSESELAPEETSHVLNWDSDSVSGVLKDGVSSEANKIEMSQKFRASVDSLSESLPDDERNPFSDISNIVISSKATTIMPHEVKVEGFKPFDSIHLLAAVVGKVAPKVGNYTELSANKTIPTIESAQLNATSYSLTGELCNEECNSSSLESIELLDEVKPEDIPILFDDRLLHAAARRTQSLRSFKKRIEAAFFAKKRLAKEYEQLAIWFGDADMESMCNHTNLPVSKSSNINDGEWELL